MALPTKGQVIDGYRFVGGDPNDEASWAPDNGLKPGAIFEGYRYLGGDPNAQKSWQPVKVEGQSRTPFAVVNDTVIEAANAALGAVGAVGNFVSPGNRLSQGVDRLIKEGEQSQSDPTQARKAALRAELQSAEGLVDEAGVAARYALENPLLTAGQAAGSFALPGGIVKAATTGARALGLGARGVTTAGTAAGSAAGVAMAGGDAAGQAYELVMQTPAETLEKNERYQALRTEGLDDKQAREALATDAARKASVVPAVVGGVSGAIGVERLLAGGKGFSGGLLSRAMKTGAAEALPEGFEEGVTGYSGRAAAATVDPSIDPMKGVGAEAVQGAIVGFVPGAAVGALDTSRQRQVAGEQKLREAPDAATAAAAANDLAGSVGELTSSIDSYLRPGLIAPAGAAPAAAVLPAARPTIQELQQRIDREAELTAQAENAGTDFERRMALEQIQATRPDASPRLASSFVELQPMSELQATQRLAVLREEVAQAGGNALGLGVVPHPNVQGKFAIEQRALPSLDLPSLPAAPVSQEQATQRLEAAAQAGQSDIRRSFFQPYEAVTDQLQRGVEAAGGVATPAAAATLDSAEVGVPANQPSRPGMQAYDAVEGQAPSGTLEVPNTLSLRNADERQAAATQQTNDASLAEYTARNQANRAQAERETQQQIAQANQPTQAPAATDVIGALVTPGPQRTAEQVSVIKQAESRYDPADFSILQRAAIAPFQLTTEERMRLRELRNPPAAASVPTTGTTAPESNTGLTGTRVLERLGQPSGGRIVSATGAKLSTQRNVAPGATVAVKDGDTDHNVNVVDVSRLGVPGRLLQQIARIFGKRLVAFESDTLQADGFVLPDDNRSIFINAKSQMSPLAVFGHELTHLLKRDNPRAYAALQAVVERELGEGAMQRFEQEYGAGADLEELTSDLVGNRFQEAGFWTEVFNEIAAQNPEGARGIITRLAAAISKAVNAFLKVVRQPGFQADQYVKDVQAVKAAVREALAQYAQDQRAPAMEMEAEQARAESRVDLGATARPEPAASAAPQTFEERRRAAIDRVRAEVGEGRPESREPVDEPAASAQFSRRKADFTDPEQRVEVSTTRPVPAPNKGRTSNSYDEKWVIDGADIRASAKHVAAVLRALQGYNTLSGKGNAEKLMQELHDVVVENLLWFHDLVPAAVRERAKLWYDGANRIATDWTSKYGVSVRQSSGVLAVLSPQMDWFKNVSLGERVIHVWRNRQNEPWSPAMTAWLESWVNASKDVDTKASRQAVLEEARPLQGVTLAEMNDRQAALFIRVFDETYHERQYRLVTPEGGFGDYVTNSDDGDASVTWGGFDTIEKAVSILNDGSFRNVEDRLGDEHKVRNFFNNIINPGSADGHVTIDTHAVAAALVKALSGSAIEVLHNFGTTPKGKPGVSGNVETGASGTYGLFADAYRDAAAKRGILPREMQSITWEAVRALFPASIKDQLAPQVDAVWDRFRKGELTRDQAREEVRELAGGIRPMAWEGTDAGKFAADGGASFNAEIPEQVDQRQARTLPPEIAKDKIQINLSANTSTIPGVAALQAAAARGDMLAHRLLQDIALDNLRHLLAGTSARVKADGVTGLYGGSVESGLSMSVSFADYDRPAVLAALAKFADNFNQEQVHVRRGIKAKAGTTFDDGSYVTPVYRWELKKGLSRKQIEKVIADSGLPGLTFGDDFVEAYYVGDPSNETARRDFDQAVDRADRLLGRAAQGVEQSVARLWAYGDGDRGLGFAGIRGDVPAGTGVSSETAKRVAGYLNQVKGKDGKPALGKVKTFDQPAEITPQQDALQTRIAQAYDVLPENDLKNPNVRKAYAELSKEVLRQFRAMPIKLEVYTGTGEPYANSAAMRRDVLDNNHLFIYGTRAETFGPEGQDFSAHPLLADSGERDVNGYKLLYNDLLRGVHDYYAHAMSPAQFGPKGEEAAWKNHMSMTSNMWARWALTMETRAQNSWVNFREGLDRSTPISQRSFAPQKAALLPVEYTLTGDRVVDKPMKEFIAKLGDKVRQGSKPGPAAKAKPAPADPAAVADTSARDQNVQFSRRRKADPKKTVTAYKLFRVNEKKPGQLFPLFIGKNEPVEMGVWYDADDIPTKGFASRPGWHAGDSPMATHIGEKSRAGLTAPDVRPANQVWAEIEMSADRDWQPEANRRGTNAQGKVIAARADIKDQIPVDGFYRYKTNPNMTGTWLIGGSIKVKRLLSDAEVARINRKAGVADLPRAEPFDLARFGFGAQSSRQRGVNVRNDGDNRYADLIVDGEKTMESRDSDSLRPYVGQTVGIIRTGEGPAKLIGSVKVGEPIEVDEQQFRELESEHLVPEGSAFDIKPDRTKFLYPLTDAQRFDNERDVASRGIVAREVQLSRQRQVDTPEFKRWFGDSKVVDENGEPLVVYHGTSYAITGRDEAISEFAGGVVAGWFGPDPKIAEQYANKFPDDDEDGSIGQQIYPAYLSIQNPFKWKGVVTNQLTATKAAKDLAAALNVDVGVIKAMITSDDQLAWRLVESRRFVDLLKSKGYDGIQQNERGFETFAAFYPEQIKSATGNSGAFDPANPDITASKQRQTDTSLPRGYVGPVSEEERKQGRLLASLEEESSKAWNAGAKKVTADVVRSMTDNLRKAGYADQEVPAEAARHFAFSLIGPGQKYDDETHPYFSDYRAAAEKAKSARAELQQMVDARIGPPEFEGMRQLADFDRAQVRTPKFRLWFKKSKVVDAQGRPLIVFHGTNKDLTEFATVREGGAVRNNNWFGQLGSWFAAPQPGVEGYEVGNAEATADVFAELRGDEGSVVYPVYLSIQNPYEVEGYESLVEERDDAGGAAAFRAKLIEQGYDGVVVRESDTDGGQIRDDWVAFYPTQIKSAIGNSGEFDPANPNITASRRRNIFNQPAPLASWTMAPDSKMDDFLYKMQDKQIDTKRVVEAIRQAAGSIDDKWNAYLQEELYHGRTAKQTADFLTSELRPLLQDMQARGVTMDEFEEFLHNRHAEERNDQIARVNPNMPDGGSGIDTADARTYLAGLDPAKRRAYDALAQRVDAISAGTRQLLVASGLETQDTIDAWERTYGSYVPLFREDTDFAAGGGAGTGQGYSVRGPASRRATGSSRPVVDILGNLAMQRERTIVRAEKARVAQAIYGMAVQNPNTDFWLAVDPEGQKDPNKAIADLVSMGINPIDAQNIIQEPVQQTIDPRTGLVVQRVNPLLRTSDNVLAVRIDGRERYVFFNANDERSQRMAGALKNLDADQLGRVMSMSAMVTRWFASVNTQFNPIFGVINFGRDVQGAVLNLTTTQIADRKAEVMAGVMPALRGIYSDLRSRRAGKGPATGTWATLWEEFQREGGQTGFRDMFARSDDRSKKLQDEINRMGRKGYDVRRLVDPNNAVFGWLSDYNETMENAVRLSAYKAALNKGLSKQQAASIAKNLTVNFNRKGQVATQMGALYAFFNAGVQGTTRLVETLRGPAGKKIVAGGLILGSAQALLLAAAGFDDDEPPEFVRERNFIIPTGDGKYITIPMPLGFNVIPNTSRVLTEFALSGWKNPTKRIGQITGAFLEMFNPIGNAGWSVQTIAPTLADPLVALAENRDWTGRPIAKKDRSDLSPTPGYTRAKETASWFSKQLSYYLNLASGGTKYKPGLISWTPDQIDYLIGQATGGVGREALKVEQSITSQFTGEELPTYKVPLLGRFYGDVKSPAAESNRFYENLKRINEHEAEIKGRRKNREGGIDEYRRANPEARLVDLANQTERDVQQLRQRRRELLERGASKETIQIQERRIATRMKRFNDRVRQVQEQAAQ